jgi:hypothetical protein
MKTARKRLSWMMIEMGISNHKGKDMLYMLITAVTI